ncbi:hypothetical protein ULMS_09910 [Patiriisocius marinistellae]|uniref:Phosphatidate phosphatase APP1 catalytic domain-containing protein n=1 Tax=Patiriisocius marinistellae TaxID=2494560 RepID=A0A5J4FUJ1_9FLAO|nr:phosphatase domain-containing protein [Patiriisocius marinistellae]GEQ85483.1 hypothetical protein ULMS_09910 [Patiriisocius marinistellae]
MDTSIFFFGNIKTTMNLFKKDPLQIIAFQTYGTKTHLYIKGRAIEDEAIDLTKRSLFSLLINTYKRFETDEIKHTKLRVTLADGRTFYTTTNKSGYYKISEDVEDLSSLINEEGWLHYEVKYEDEISGRIINHNNKFPGEMLIPKDNSEYGIISDIDDTILHTGVVSKFKWRLIVNTLFKRAERRSPLEGAADFYHKLHRGSDGEKANPVYYVSHSPWNLYRYLEVFLMKNTFPKGPILLRTLSNFFGKKSLDEKPQKQKEIIQLLEMYPEQQFILIGDSGEHDADIYIEIAEAFPNRIKAIYLRSVKHEARMLRIKGLFENYKTTPTLLVESSEQAEMHAREQGFIA